jgi:hypothetical protein
MSEQQTQVYFALKGIKSYKGLLAIFCDFWLFLTIFLLRLVSTKGWGGPRFSDERVGSPPLILTQFDLWQCPLALYHAMLPTIRCPRWNANAGECLARVRHIRWRANAGTKSQVESQFLAQVNRHDITYVVPYNLTCDLVPALAC